MRNLETKNKNVAFLSDDEKPYCSNVESSTDIANFLNKLTIFMNR